MKVKHKPQIDGPIGWLETSPYKDKFEGSSLTQDCKFDYVIIGAGYTGLSAARRLAELNPDASIAVFDALKVGEGASGRNSGFLMDIPTAAYTDGYNHDFAIGIVKINRFGVKKLKSLVDEFNLDVDWSEQGHLLAACSDNNYAKLDKYTNALNQLGEHFEVWNEEQLSKTLGTDYYSKAIYTKGGVLVNPVSLIIGLAQSLPANVNVFENSPIDQINFGLKNQLTIGQYVIEAKTLLVAANAFNEVLHVADHKLAPISTYASMTRVLTEQELENFEGIEHYGLTPAHAAGTTVRFTSDKRILIRNGLQASLESKEKDLLKAEAVHRKSLANRFPCLKDVPFEYCWGGNLCVTMNGQSHFHKHNENLFSIGGMNGTGVAKGTFLGHYMAELMCNVEGQELAFIKQYSQPTWVPPEPIRGIGVSMRLSLEQLLAGKEV